MDSREFALQQAIEDLQNDPSQSIRSIAKQYAVKEATIRGRMKGATTRAIAHEHEQRLSPLQEEFLVDWILEQDEHGYPPSHARARAMATRILQMNGQSAPLGNRWIQKFTTRNPRIASVIGRKIEAARIQGTTQEAIQEFYDRFSQVQSEYSILEQDVWNMDEHGIALGVCMNSRVLASSKKKRTYKKSPENREWVSIIETINPSGKIIKLLIPFKGQDVQTSWFIQDTPDWTYTTSENGWTSHKVAFGWLEHIFEPQTRPESNSHRMLVMDGHGSHCDLEFMWRCKQMNIQLVFLPPHSSHVLQPLDLGVFSPLKTRYRKSIADLAHLDDTTPVKKQRFIHCYSLARVEALTPRVLRAGWKAAGLFPWNPQKGLQSSQVKQLVQKRAVTPPEQSTLQITWKTPKSSQQLHITVQTLRKSKEPDQTVRYIFDKAGKAIARLNAEQALSLHIIEAQEAKLHNLHSAKTRKRITVNPNTLFVNIDQIKKAQEEQAAAEAAAAVKKPYLDAKKAAEAMQNITLQACQFEWQLEQ